MLKTCRGVDGLDIYKLRRTNYEKQKNELNYLHNLYDKIDEKFEYKLKKLEYGPGFPVPLYNTDDFSDTLYPLKSLEKVFGQN